MVGMARSALLRIDAAQREDLAMKTIQQELEQGAGSSRRDFLKIAGAGTAATFGVITLDSSGAQGAAFDAEYDIVVAGGGGAGLPAALFSRWLGNTVLILEKAATMGGTSFKAAYWYWVPNNMAMRKAGMEDPKPDFLKYAARLSQPQSYDANHPRYGLSEWEYSMCEAIYDSAADAAELLAEKDALPYRHVAPAADYFSELPEDKAKTGRVLFPRDVTAWTSRPAIVCHAAVSVRVATCPPLDIDAEPCNR
jgi:3-oxosteroid 1-dehydrogenase